MDAVQPTTSKGPAVASLFAMKALKESGLTLKRKIRLIFGTHEELTAGWTDLKYYFTKYPRPDIGFRPDAGFPVIHGEKGYLVSLEKTDRGGMLIKATGVSVHASTPEKGTNAIFFLFDFLAQCPGLNASVAEFSRNYRKKISFQVYGESIGCELKDDISGPLTSNVGVAAGDKEKIDLSVNIRYPISFEGEKVIDGIKTALESTGIEFRLIDDSKPLFVPKDDELVQKLMNAYREETGDYTSEPITIGGGTYVRAQPKGVAFGALFPGKEKLAHEKNEYIEIDDLISGTRIFASALYSLAG